jgi:hypothetical protein
MERISRYQLDLPTSGITKFRVEAVEIGHTERRTDIARAHFCNSSLRTLQNTKERRKKEQKERNKERKRRERGLYRGCPRLGCSLLVSGCTSSGPIMSFLREHKFRKCEQKEMRETI